ncbi:MAG: TetR/AcrR family transcriptional regulator [Spirochaetaceae bacterium]|nr:MAG: TetR/AcrR family transcriptional regulator [Spirochaetaceae bacterium]
MNDRKQELKDRILTIAFTEWAKTNFMKMSLSLVTAKLGVTKPALYRHFRNKDDLLDAMQQRFSLDVSTAVDAFVSNAGREKSAENNFARGIRAYFRFLFDFFTQKPYYCSFFLFYFLKKAAQEHGQGLLMRYPALIDFFRKILGLPQPKNGNFRIERLARFINLTGFFWILRLYKGGRKKDCNHESLDFSRRITEKEISAEMEQAIVFCINGYFPDLSENAVDYGIVEEKAWIGREEMLEPDRIFSAVESVVSEMGWAEASVERIAERIGINKSSLYFYFRNKDEMLLETIRREQEQMLKLVQQRVSMFEGSVERLYAFFVAVVSNIGNNPTLLTVLHWMHFQNIGLTLPQKDSDRLRKEFEDLRFTVTTAPASRDDKTEETIFLFMFFLLMSEMGLMSAVKAGKKKDMDGLRQLFELFRSGMTGAQKEKINAVDY